MLKLDPYEIPKSREELEQAYKELARVHELSRRQYEAQIKFLQDRLKVIARQTFAHNSDRVAEALFNEAEVISAMQEVDNPLEDDGEKKAKQKKKKRPFIPEHLPREDVRHELPVDQRKCHVDGHPLHEAGQEVREELEFVPAKLRVRRHILVKYACRHCQEMMITASTPKRMIAGSQAGSGLIAHVAISKYMDHIPLHRQESQFHRLGVNLSRTTMANWMIKVGELLLPIRNLILDRIIEGQVVQCDETPLRVIKIDGEVVDKKSYMWCMARWGPGPKYVLYEFDRTRSSAVPKRLFSEYKGYLQVDGYSGYDGLCANNEGIKRVGCMAHVRRKFVETLDAIAKSEQPRHPAANVIRLLAELYKIEDSVRQSAPEIRKATRSQNSKAIFEQLKQYVESEHSRNAPSSLYGKALSYASKELPLIERYLEDGQIELDNNLIENAIRPFALGKKNWLFSETEIGAEASAVIYTVLRTAFANGLNPLQYLTETFERLPYCATVEDYEALLPIPKVH
jgi:transposase